MEDYVPMGMLFCEQSCCRCDIHLMAISIISVFSIRPCPCKGEEKIHEANTREIETDADKPGCDTPQLGHLVLQPV